MLFNSFQFLIFFPLVVTVYFSLPYKYRWTWLLLASCYFYMSWKPSYILLIFISAGIDYLVALKIDGIPEKTRRRNYLMVSLFSNLGILFLFKYFNFFSRQLGRGLGYFSVPSSLPVVELVLPIGISFYTFQALSYTIDVYRGEKRAERRFGIFSLYIMFFPQLVAGPIERSTRLLPQFDKQYDFDYRRVTDGLKLMAWGFFKKVVIADRLAIFVETVYQDPTRYEGLALVLATVFFAFQVYCDFSGYSDIGIGGAQVMGLKLMNNFNRPYFSKSIAEFWRRWHISLSTWFKDYLYMPLGGNRVTIPRWSFNVFFTFLVSGLWHGANWTFIVWGTLHGFYILFSRWTKGIRKRWVDGVGLSRFPKLHQCLQIFITFSLVCFGYIFFRAETISDAFYIVTHLFAGWGNVAARFHDPEVWSYPVFLGQPREEFLIALISILAMESVHVIQRRGSIREKLSGKPTWLRWSLYHALVVSIFLFGKIFSGAREFIYFQF